MTRIFLRLNASMAGAETILNPSDVYANALTAKPTSTVEAPSQSAYSAMSTFTICCPIASAPLATKMLTNAGVQILPFDSPSNATAPP